MRSVLVGLLGVLALQGCRQSDAATLPEGRTRLDSIPAGQVPATVAVEHEGAMVSCGAFRVRVSDATAQHWIGDQWMYRLSASVTNASGEPRYIGIGAFDVSAILPDRMEMAWLPSTVLAPSQTVAAAVVWSARSVGALPSTVIFVAPPISTVPQTCAIPISFRPLAGDANQVVYPSNGAPPATATTPTTDGAAGAPGASTQVGFFARVREHFAPTPFEIVLGASSYGLIGAGTWEVIVHATVTNRSDRPADIRRDEFHATGDGVPLLDVHEEETFPFAMTLPPGQMVTGTVRWHAMSPSPRIEVTYGAPNASGRRPFQQVLPVP